MEQADILTGLRTRSARHIEEKMQSLLIPLACRMSGLPWS